ncbi:TPA: G5 domain-containing protein [Streptococcus suis]|nr:G5 domain-containing protein [Streptococcus suis]HEM6190220.1 G5 domain-containing protein [Streptococcus suis]
MKKATNQVEKKNIFGIRKSKIAGTVSAVIAILGIFGATVTVSADTATISYNYVTTNELSQSEKEQIVSAIPQHVKADTTVYVVYQPKNTTNLPNTGDIQTPILATLGTGLIVLAITVVGKGKKKRKVISGLFTLATIGGSFIAQPLAAIQVTTFAHLSQSVTLTVGDELPSGIKDIAGFEFVGYIYHTDASQEIGTVPTIEEKSTSSSDITVKPSSSVQNNEVAPEHTSQTSSETAISNTSPIHGSLSLNVPETSTSVNEQTSEVTSTTGNGPEPSTETVNSESLPTSSTEPKSEIVKTSEVIETSSVSTVMSDSISYSSEVVTSLEYGSQLSESIIYSTEIIYSEITSTDSNGSTVSSTTEVSVPTSTIESVIVSTSTETSEIISTSSIVQVPSETTVITSEVVESSEVIIHSETPTSSENSVTNSESSNSSETAIDSQEQTISENSVTNSESSNSSETAINSQEQTHSETETIPEQFETITETLVEIIPFETITKTDNTVWLSDSPTLEVSGQNGSNTFKVSKKIDKNGQVISEEKVLVEHIEPINQVIVVGTKEFELVEETVTETIPFETKQITDATKWKDDIPTVKESGVNGTNSFKVTKKVDKNGQVISEEKILGEHIEPVTQVIVSGTKEFELVEETVTETIPFETKQITDATKWKDENPTVKESGVNGTNSFKVTKKVDKNGQVISEEKILVEHIEPITQVTVVGTKEFEEKITVSKEIIPFTTIEEKDSTKYSSEPKQILVIGKNGLNEITTITKVTKDGTVISTSSSSKELEKMIPEHIVVGTKVVSENDLLLEIPVEAIYSYDSTLTGYFGDAKNLVSAEEIHAYPDEKKVLAWDSEALDQFASAENLTQEQASKLENILNKEKLVQEFMTILNEGRRAEGLVPMEVSTDPVILAGSQQRATEMAEYGSLRYKGTPEGAHKRPDGTNWQTVFTQDELSGYSQIAENMGMRVGDNIVELLDEKYLAQSIYTQWYLSPGHKKVMMLDIDNPRFAFSVSFGDKMEFNNENSNPNILAIFNLIVTNVATDGQEYVWISAKP